MKIFDNLILALFIYVVFVFITMQILTNPPFWCFILLGLIASVIGNFIHNEYDL